MSTRPVPEDEQRCVYIGTMSGTSLDGLDLAALDISSLGAIRWLGCATTPLPPDLRGDLLQLARTSTPTWAQIGRADSELGRFTGQCVNDLLVSLRLRRQDVAAIGSHGQTVHHAPDGNPPFTVQLGDPHRIAAVTGLTVVADFRRTDVAHGGQGAPLVPLFHRHLFDGANSMANLPAIASARVVVNIGGIANITELGADGRISGCDSGPGNTLMDAWCREQQVGEYDADGAWAASGRVLEPLLERWLEDPYFKRSPPKSTGPEHFSRAWMEAAMTGRESPEDVQRTLVELTAQSLCDEIRRSAGQPDRLILCGGGRHNRLLCQRISALQPSPVVSCDELGVDGDGLEAAAFAWLAYRTLQGLPGNASNVTGATGDCVLGHITPAQAHRTPG